jgi:hypothetical protein
LNPEDRSASLEAVSGTSRIPSLTRRSWLGWLCLLGLVGSLSWVRLLVVTGLAWVDGSHTVRLGAAGQGWTVVLGHAGQGAGSGPTVAASSGYGSHQHGPTARMLLVLSECRPGEPDHVLKIEGAAPARLVASVSVPLPPTVLGGSVLPAFSARVGGADQVPGLQSRPPPRPPPRPPVFLAQLRTTVLVV